MTLTEIRQVLAARGLRPLKQLGQNFLHDQNMARWLAGEIVAGAPDNAHLVEIGPGLGALTQMLLERRVALTVLEKDRGLCRYLEERFQQQIAAGRLNLREGDALERLPQLDFCPPVICGNLPYYISTPLLMECLELPGAPHLFFVMQKEVGERLTGRPGTKAYGAISVLVQVRYEVEIRRILPGSVFYPAPEVSSCAIRLRPRVEPLLGPEEDRGGFARFVQKGFSQRRKVLSNLLPTQEKRRAEELSPPEWLGLWRETPTA
jgi:16S rRNA (adenine1518-N6/adenine1519-N6)-dimethyltransferase